MRPSFGVNVEKEFQGEELKIRDQSGNALVVFGAGDEVEAPLVSLVFGFCRFPGMPLREPGAHGPIVMTPEKSHRLLFGN